MVGHPQGGRCAGTVHEMTPCIFRRVVDCALRAPVANSMLAHNAMEVKRGQGHMQASLELTL